MAFKLVGVSEFQAALRKSVADADRGARMAAVRAAAAVEVAAKRKLGASSHSKGTPTPSKPGQPPSLITGTLRRSVRSFPAERVGANAWQTQVGPTAVYARIQELGGTLGANPRHGMWRRPATLPARPYLTPAVRELIDSGELWTAFRSGWERF